MGVRIDPVTGNVTGASGSMGGGWPEVTTEQRELAKDRASWLLAEKIHDWAKKPEGGKWFSRWSINLTKEQMEIVTRGCALGIFKKDEHKEYWRHTPITWKWLLTAMALADEWRQSDECKRIQAAIAPRQTSGGTNPKNLPPTTPS